MDERTSVKNRDDSKGGELDRVNESRMADETHQNGNGIITAERNKY